MKENRFVRVTLIFLLVFMFAVLSGCTGSAEKGAVSNPAQNKKSEVQAKMVEFCSKPEGAFVLLDGKEIGVTPFQYKIPFGTYTVKFLKENYYEVSKSGVNIGKDTDTISVKLMQSDAYDNYINQGGQSEIVFDTVPRLRRPDRWFSGYSGIFYGGTYKISGTASTKWFDIVFPSGKKVHFVPKKLGATKWQFSKTVTFNETGTYKIITEKHTYSFYVDYKVTILPPTQQLKDIFPKSNYKNAIAVPNGKEITAKILVTDANGTPIKNKTLGRYNLKTDSKGITTFRIKIDASTFNSVPTIKMYINGKYASDNMVICSNLIAIPYGEALFSKNGHLISSTIPDINSDVKAVSYNDDVYIPYNAFGFYLSSWYALNCDTKNMEVVSTEKNPSVIYTNNYVSTDGGAHWEQIISSEAMAVDANKPNVLYGYSFSNPYGTAALFQSTDYGKHPVPILETKDIIKQIVTYPGSSDTVYLIASGKLLKLTVGSRETEECGPNAASVNTAAVNPKNANEIIVSTNKGMFLSEDACKTWKEVHFSGNSLGVGSGINCIAISRKNPDIVYAGGTGLFVSKDRGRNFEKLGDYEIFGHNAIAVNPESPGNVYIYDAKQGVFESKDYGKHFSKIGFPMDAMNAAITVNANGDVFANAQCIPFELEKGVFVPLGKDTILKNGPEFKIINRHIYISISTINSEYMRGIVNGDFLHIYKIVGQ